MTPNWIDLWNPVSKINNHIFSQGVRGLNTLQQYKCPCCDGAIEFDSTVQKMKCPYCDTEFEMQTLLAYDQELQNQPEEQMQWDAAAGDQWAEGEEDALRAYVCQACGGEILAEQTTGATECPFCGNPVVMMTQFSGTLKPDYVIPFKLTKKDAVAALKKHYQGKRLLPKVFKDENHIDEVKGIYVPFWLFDADANAHIRYKASRTRTWSDSNYNYTETSYYSVVRGGEIGFQRVPVDGSVKMDDTLMESIEPYDFSGVTGFQTAYLAGYLADRYDVDSEQSIERANQRIRTSTENAFAETVQGYHSVIPVSTNIQLSNGVVKYALYPVWLLNTSWNGNRYTFAINGQTGKLAGDLPLDKAAYRKWLLGLTGVFSAVALAVSYLLWLL